MTTAAAERIKREAEFHDQRFGSTEKRAADAFYVVAQQAYREYDKQIVADVAGLSVLELGAGIESRAFMLAAAGAKVSGIDISPVAVEQSQREAERLGLSCRFEVMNAEELTYANASFDRVCGAGILHHLSLKASYAEIARVLKPGGKATFVEPLGHNPVINLYRNRTPEQRTPDEHPLLTKDFQEAKNYFKSVQTRCFHLASLAALPFRRMKHFETVLRILDRVDAVILSDRSPLRWGAWMVVVTLEA